MNENTKDQMVIKALLERFEKHRLPRLLDIREKVNQGNKLDDYDMNFLDEVFQDARKNEHYISELNDDLKTLIMKMLSLYKEITQKGLENEQKT